MKRAILIMLAVGLTMISDQIAAGQFPLRIPTIPKIEKPAETTRTDPSANGGSVSNPSGRKSRNSTYGDVRRDATPRLVKDSVYVQAETTKEYWKAPGQKGYHSWAPKMRFDLFYNHATELKFVAEYYNPEGTLWFSAPLEIGNAADDDTNLVQSDRTNPSKILRTNSSISTGLFGFKIKESSTGETFYHGKFKVGKFLPPYSAKNEFDFYVDHDWLMPIGIVSFHHSQFRNFGDNIGGFELFLNFWFKGNFGSSDHGLEARLFYKGLQITTTADGGGVRQSGIGGCRRTHERKRHIRRGRASLAEVELPMETDTCR